MMDEKNPEVSDQQIMELAEEVCRRKLQEIVLFFLEAHRPLRGIFYQLTIISTPLLAPFFGASKRELLLHIMESDEQLQRLIDSIEEVSKLGMGRVQKEASSGS